MLTDAPGRGRWDRRTRPAILRLLDAAVFVDRGFLGAQRVLIPYLGSAHDRFALELGGRLAREAKAEITALHIVAPKRVAGDSLHATTAIDRVFNDPSQPAPVHVRVVESEYPVDAVLEASHDFDLIVIGVSEEWGLASHLFGWRSERIAEACSTAMLIVRKRLPAPPLKWWCPWYATLWGRVIHNPQLIVS